MRFDLSGFRRQSVAFKKVRKREEIRENDGKSKRPWNYWKCYRKRLFTFEIKSETALQNIMIPFLYCKRILTNHGIISKPKLHERIFQTININSINEWNRLSQRGRMQRRWVQILVVAGRCSPHLRHQLVRVRLRDELLQLCRVL